MQKTNSDDHLKYSASVRLNDDRSARIAALQAEIEALSARSNAVEHQLATARATFERLKGAFVSEIEAHSARSNAVEPPGEARATFERLKAFVSEIEAHSARSNAVEHHLASARRRAPESAFASSMTSSNGNGCAARGSGHGLPSSGSTSTACRIKLRNCTIKLRPIRTTWNCSASKSSAWMLN